jgi:hypothetical protein
VELSIDLVEIKGLRIKLAPDPFQHLLVLGVLRILYGVQKARIPVGSKKSNACRPKDVSARHHPALALISLE